MRTNFYLNVGMRSAAAAIIVCVLSACNAKPSAEVQWARAALERNPQVKVLSVDADQQTIRIRIVATGEETTVSVGELAAIPIGELMAMNAAVVNASRQAASLPAKSIATPTPAPQETAAPAPTLPEPTTPVETVSATTRPATTSEPLAAYKVEREDGRVRVNGPGVSIESAATPNANSKTARRDDPIVCDGPRFMHLDGRHLNVDGDGIIARGGCELHITNTTIAASGTGITVLDATVHITNSDIRGDDSSLTTSSAAHVFLRNSKFSGLARRNPQAEIRELGGNTWR